MITIFSNIKIYAINDSYLDTTELKGCTTVEYFKRNRVEELLMYNKSSIFKVRDIYFCYLGSLFRDEELEDSPHYIGWRIKEINK